MINALKKWAETNNVQLRADEKDVNSIVLAIKDGDELFDIGNVFVFSNDGYDSVNGPHKIDLNSENIGFGFDSNASDSGEDGFDDIEDAAQSLLDEWREATPRIWHEAEGMLYCLKPAGDMKIVNCGLEMAYCNDLVIKVEAQCPHIGEVKWNAKDKADREQALVKHILDLLKENPFKG